MYSFIEHLHVHRVKNRLLDGMQIGQVCEVCVLLEQLLLPPNFSPKSQTLVEKYSHSLEFNSLNGNAINISPKNALSDKLIYLRTPPQEPT